MNTRNINKEPGILRIVSNGILPYDCKIYDHEDHELTEQLAPAAITVFMQGGQLNEASIEIQHIKIDVLGEGRVIFKIQKPVDKTFTSEEEQEYKRQFLQIIRNLDVDKIEFE